jgi:LacI family transcriptional regulator
MPITIKDLAKKLNLSITQVSRALGGYSDVSEETRQKVIRAAHELGYEPSYAARQLRLQRANAIGYILPTSSPRFSDPFYSSFLAGLCDEASKFQLDLVISSSPPNSNLERNLYQRWIQSKRVDGVIINRVRNKDWRIDYLSENKLPFVTLGLPESDHTLPAVKVDERGGFKNLVNYLVEKGYNRIAYIGGPPDLAVQRERFLGYVQGLEESGLTFDHHFVTSSDLTEDGGYHGAQQLLLGPTKPNAFLGCNDQIAIGALRAAKEAGFKIGINFAIAGYDGIRETEYTDPPLTTLYQPTYEIARKLVEMLYKVINRYAIEDIRPVFIPDLIIRASTEKL